MNWCWVWDMAIAVNIISSNFCDIAHGGFFIRFVIFSVFNKLQSVKYYFQWFSLLLYLVTLSLVIYHSFVHCENCVKSQLVETRIQLIMKLGVAVPPEKNPDVDALLEFLIVSHFLSFKCLSMLQFLCFWNRSPWTYSRTFVVLELEFFWLYSWPCAICKKSDYSSFMQCFIVISLCLVKNSSSICQNTCC